jgi:hypothetical protein
MAATDGKRIAQCGCGSLTATVTGDPVTVYSCSCVACQRKSGSVFTYAAVFPSAAVAITGEYKAWRHTGDSGRWIENMFCPTCGIAVAFHAEGFRELTGIPVGGFGDPDFAPPLRLYWASRRHRWLTFHNDLTLLDTQDD